MTPLKVSIVASIASLLLLLIVFELIRSRRLRERYAILWLATGFVLLVLSAWRGGLNTIASWFGVTGYPPAVLFAVATLFILAVLLHYSTVISKLADQNVILAQRLALLEQTVDLADQRRLAEPGDGPLEPIAEARARAEPEELGGARRVQ
jgi:cell division protein FtsW (lipid II flippase)